MTLIRWNPVHDISAWHPVSGWGNEFDRLFDRLRGGIIDNSGAASFMPAVDIIEDANDFNIRIELPGVKKEDVKITVQNNVLTVRGEKKQEAEKKGDNYQRLERSYGSFQRSFTLPNSLTADKVEASYDNGVLTISLPKAEEAKLKEIEVKVK